MSFNRSYRSCLVFYFHGSYMFFLNRGRWLWDSKHDTRFLCLKLVKLMCCARLWQWMPVRCLELDDGKIYRKALYLMVKTMVSCRFSLKPIQWLLDVWNCVQKNKNRQVHLRFPLLSTMGPWDVESQASWCRSTGVALSGLWSSTTALGPSEKWGKALEVDEIWWNCLEHLEAQTIHHPIFCMGWRPEGFCSFFIFFGEFVV